MNIFFEKQRKIEIFFWKAKEDFLNVKPLKEGDFYHMFCMKITTPADLPPDPIWFYSYFVKKLQKLLALDIPKYKDIFSTIPPQFENELKARIQTDYAMAEVYFQTLNVININQSPALDVSIFILSTDSKFRVSNQGPIELSNSCQSGAHRRVCYDIK